MAVYVGEHVLYACVNLCKCQGCGSLVRKSCLIIETIECHPVENTLEGAAFMSCHGGESG